MWYMTFLFLFLFLSTSVCFSYYCPHTSIKSVSSKNMIFWGFVSKILQLWIFTLRLNLPKVSLGLGPSVCCGQLYGSTSDILNTNITLLKRLSVVLMSLKTKIFPSNYREDGLYSLINWVTDWKKPQISQICHNLKYPNFSRSPIFLGSFIYFKSLRSQRSTRHPVCPRPT